MPSFELRDGPNPYLQLIITQVFLTQHNLVVSSRLLHRSRKKTRKTYPKQNDSPVSWRQNLWLSDIIA